MLVAVDDGFAEEFEQFSGAVAAAFEIKQCWGGIDQCGDSLTRRKGVVVNDVFDKGNIGFDPANTELAQSTIHALDGEIEALRRGGQLHEERVIKRGNDGTGIAHRAIQSDSKASGTSVADYLTIIGCKVLLGILRRDAGLYRVAVAWYFVLRRHADLVAKETVSLRDEALCTDDIDPSNHFGHGVLDLNAWVHLNKKPFVGIKIEEELDGASVIITDGLSDFDSSLAEVMAHIVGQAYRGGDFDDFLMATLNGAVALMKVDDVTLLIADDLYFDVFGTTDIALEKDGVVAEGATRLALGFVEEWNQIFGIFDHAHAATTATEGCLNNERKSDFLGRLDRFFAIADGILGARKRRDIGLFGNFASLDFIAHAAKEIRAGTDEVEAIFFTGAGEISVFREEPIAWVNEVDALSLGKVDDAGNIEVSRNRPIPFTDEVGFIGLKTVDT